MVGSEVLKMRRVMKRAMALLCLIAGIAGLIPVTAAASMLTDIKIQLSDEEQSLVSRTQNIEPIHIGIIPHTFPLSDCPPDAADFEGMNVEMLDKISEISGLRFQYFRIPIEEETPYQTLQKRSVELVAGTIKLDSFMADPELILSDRLCDGSAVCIARKGTNPSKPATGKIAVMKGYQAGFEFAEKLFPAYEVVFCPDNREVLRAVREDTADLAIISRYVGIYELQSPMNENLTELTMYKMEKDSCVMGNNTPENQVVISIVNKALAAIGEDGYNYIQMNFSLTNPYKLTVIELMYKYRHMLLVAGAAFAVFFFLTVRLIYTQNEHRRLSLDGLTGAYSEAGFELATAKILPRVSKQLFVTDFDIVRFSSYNELNGKAEGDELLKHIVVIVKSLLCEQDVICRSYADHFKVLSSKESLEDLIADIQMAVKRFNEAAQSTIAFNFGIYPVTDNTVPITKMLDFAAMAKKYVKEDTSSYIGVFDEELLKRWVNEAKMTTAFQSAVDSKEFKAYYQPKFDASKKTVIGAEALVRWVTGNGTVIPPVQFIELFEKSGQIQRLDFYMLEEVCAFLSSLRAKGLSVLPIAVNFSRVHLYSDAFVYEVNQMVERYGIPKHLIEIECTETTMINNIDMTREIFGSLQKQGFSIAMDDFGSAYSSLNTLCSIPLDVLKLDRGFLMATLSHEKEKADIIIKSVMTLAHDLSLKVVAEGVETEEQYQFLKSLGCDFIQGYYFSKPLEEAQFLKLLTET